MGMVLAFVPKQSASGHRPIPGRLAPVIIFPGVRYERLEAAAETPARKDGKPRRRGLTRRADA